MKHYDITKPIGLTTPCNEIESTCNNAHMYKRCGLRPKHYIIPLDSGSGRTTLIEYMTDKYKEAGVLSFTSGLDDYIEITFDGSLQQLKQAFCVIDSAAVYTNDYCNIIGMDISDISAHLGETQLPEFMKNCKRVCEHACVIFFVHATPSRNEEKLLDKLCETVVNIKRLEVEPYTKKDICALIIKTVEKHGIEIKHDKALTLLEDFSHERKAATLTFPLAGATNNRNVRLAVIGVFPSVLDIYHWTRAVHSLRGYMESALDFVNGIPTFTPAHLISLLSASLCQQVIIDSRLFSSTAGMKPEKSAKWTRASAVEIASFTLVIPNSETMSVRTV